MFTNLQLRGIQATDARSDFAFADYFTLRLLASLTGLAAILLIVLVGRYDRATGVMILLVGMSKTVESLGDVIAGLLQKAERLDRVAISLMIKGGLSLPAFAAAFWFSRNLIHAVAALVMIWLLVFVFYDMRQARALIRGSDNFFSFRWPRLKTLTLISAPLGIVMTLVSLNVNIPRYVLEHNLGPAELGIFASLAYLMVAFNVVINALGQAVVSRLSRMFAEGESERFRAVLGKMSAFGVLVLVLGVPVAKVVGRPLLAFIYQPEYGQHVSLFVILVATAGVYSVASFLSYGLTAARCFRMQVPIMVAATAGTILFSFLLIPHFGGNGAAWALLIGTFVQVIAGAWVLQRAVPGVA
jgi:O-antigen/teichoic acid export membrane protein